MDNTTFFKEIFSYIVDLYKVSEDERASNFIGCRKYDLDNETKKTVIKLFKKIKVTPIKATIPDKEKIYNFLLSNKKTLSIRTSVSSSKIAPRVVGQSGYETFNKVFKPYLNSEIKNQKDIKSFVYNNIAEIMPVFVSFMFQSDYTFYISKIKEKVTSTIYTRDNVIDIDYRPSKFSFSRSLNDWNESNTIYYQMKNRKIPIAEVQTHRKRTFKFRFNMKYLPQLIKEEKETTESLGTSAEYALCEAFNLTTRPFIKKKDINNDAKIEIEKVIKNYFLKNGLPKPTEYIGNKSGNRKGSKSPWDFLLEGNKTLSLKTNKEGSDKVCPPEIGQPNNETFDLYFERYVKAPVTQPIFKRFVFNNVEFLIKKYMEFLFDSDYLLWIKEDKNGDFSLDYFPKHYGCNFKWDPNKFSFTCDLNSWNESNTVKYNGVTLGEFQVHKNRNCYKFRFDLSNLEKIIGPE